MSTEFRKPWKPYLWQVLVCGILKQHDWVSFGALKCCRRCDSLRVAQGVEE